MNKKPTSPHIIQKNIQIVGSSLWSTEKKSGKEKVKKLKKKLEKIQEKLRDTVSNLEKDIEERDQKIEVLEKEKGDLEEENRSFKERDLEQKRKREGVRKKREKQREIDAPYLRINIKQKIEEKKQEFLLRCTIHGISREERSEINKAFTPGEFNEKCKDLREILIHLETDFIQEFVEIYTGIQALYSFETKRLCLNFEYCKRISEIVVKYIQENIEEIDVLRDRTLRELGLFIWNIALKNNAETSKWCLLDNELSELTNDQKQEIEEIYQDIFSKK